MKKSLFIRMVALGMVPCLTFSAEFRGLRTEQKPSWAFSRLVLSTQSSLLYFGSEALAEQVLSEWEPMIAEDSKAGLQRAAARVDEISPEVWSVLSGLKASDFHSLFSDSKPRRRIVEAIKLSRSHTWAELIERLAENYGKTNARSMVAVIQKLFSPQESVSEMPAPSAGSLKSRISNWIIRRLRAGIRIHVIHHRWGPGDLLRMHGGFTNKVDSSFGTREAILLLPLAIARGYLRPDKTTGRPQSPEKKRRRVKKPRSGSGPQAIGGIALWVARRIFALRLFPARQELDLRLQNHRAAGDLIVLDRQTDQMTPLRYVRADTLSKEDREKAADSLIQWDVKLMEIAREKIRNKAINALRPERSELDLSTLRLVMAPDGAIEGFLVMDDAAMQITMASVRPEKQGFERYADVHSEMMRRACEELLTHKNQEFITSIDLPNAKPAYVDQLGADYFRRSSPGTIIMRQDGVRIFTEKQWSRTAHEASERAARDLAFQIAGKVETLIFLGVPLAIDLAVRLVTHHHLPWYGLLALVITSAVVFMALHWSGVWRAVIEPEESSPLAGDSLINGVRYRFQKFGGSTDPVRWNAWITLFWRGVGFHFGFYLFFVFGYHLLSYAPETSWFTEMVAYGILLGQSVLAADDHDHYNHHEAPKTGGPLAMQTAVPSALANRVIPFIALLLTVWTVLVRAAEIPFTKVLVQRAAKTVLAQESETKPPTVPKTSLMKEYLLLSDHLFTLIRTWEADRKNKKKWRLICAEVREGSIYLDSQLRRVNAVGPPSDITEEERKRGVVVRAGALTATSWYTSTKQEMADPEKFRGRPSNPLPTKPPIGRPKESRRIEIAA